MSSRAIGPARIAKQNDVGDKLVQTLDGERSYWLVCGSRNATPAPVGARGTLVWVQSSGWGLPFFEAEEG